MVPPRSSNSKPRRPRRMMEFSYVLPMTRRLFFNRRRSQRSQKLLRNPRPTPDPCQVMNQSMAGNIPFEIQVEIMKRAPVKSLIQFRAVSKEWKSIIDSPEFINHHSSFNQQHHQLVCHHSNSNSNSKVNNYVLVVDDDSFPLRKLSFSPPTFSPTLRCLSILDCSHGLVCLFGIDPDPRPLKQLIVVSNPSIRKFVSILLPNNGFTGLGCGVCVKTRDPKILRITGTTCMDFKAEVFRLSDTAWTTVSMDHLPYISIQCLSNQVVIDGAICWVAFVRITNNESTTTTSTRILSFDLTSEEFKERPLPDNLAREVHVPSGMAHPDLSLSKIKESLVVLNYCTDDAGNRVCGVWMMLKNGVSFTKLYTVKASTPDGLATYNITGFRKTGQPIMEQRYKKHDASLASELKVYDLSSQHVEGLEIYGSFFKTTSYTESLLLLNHHCPTLPIHA